MPLKLLEEDESPGKASNSGTSYAEDSDKP